MKQEKCPYCMEGEFLAGFGVKAFETKTSKVIVFKDQAHKGRAIVAYKDDHVAEIQDLSDEERNAFMKDVSDVAKSIQAAYKPDRINYGAFGDALGHLHFHIVPKYKDGIWGGMFVMNNGADKYASEEEINEVCKNIKAEYEKLVK